MNNSTHFNVEFSTNSPPLTRVSKDLAIFVIAFLGINTLVTTFGNARMLFAFRIRRDLRKVPHYFLANLALTGFLSALVTMPNLILMTTVNYFGLSANPPAAIEVFCKLGFSLTFAFNVLHALTFSLMALDRQDRVLSPFSPRVTQTKVRRIIPLTWVLSLLTAVVIAILIRNEEQSACVKYYHYHDTISFSNAVHAVAFAARQVDIITILIITTTYIRIRKKLRSFAISSSSSANRRQEKQLTKLTFNICALFLLFRLLVILCRSMTKFGEFRGTTTNSVTLVTVALAASLNVAIPFFHHKMLQVRPPNQQHTDQPRVTAWRAAAARTETNGVELSRFARTNPQ